MRRARVRNIVLPALAALTGVLAPGRMCAQSAERPLLVISMTAGFLAGGELWRLDLGVPVAKAEDAALSMPYSQRIPPFLGIVAQFL